MSISSPGLENVQNTNHGNHTVQLALVTNYSFTSNCTTHEVTIAHIMKGGYFISIFFPKNSDLSCVHNEGGSGNTAGTDVVNTHYYQIETHMFSIAMFHND